MLSLTQLRTSHLRLPTRGEWIHLFRRLPGRFVKFLRAAYIDGPKAVLRGEFTHRQGLFLCLATLPILIGALFITLPEVLFPSPGHRAYYHFAISVGNELVAMVPVIIGMVATTFGLRLPLDG
ncbi:MAG: hypothetical protein MUF31_06090 [Akkermansiaceae bacterium]|jgi:hypothetical protein|nr:hypothetical protein [Akkermansiaceae bacterium]